MKKYSLLFLFTMLLTGIAGAQIDRSVQPKPGPAPIIEITKPKTFNLKNGLKVMVVENHKLPQVSVRLLIDNPIHPEGKLAGVSAILSSMMGNGTLSISKDAYNEEIDYLGASVGFGNEYASASSLSKYFPRVLHLLADGLQNPLFAVEEFKSNQARLIENIKVSEKSVAEVGSRVNTALTYGKNHPSGEFITIESLEAIKMSDVKEYYNSYFTPNNAYLVIVGDVDFKEVKKLVTNEFSKWEKQQLPSVSFPTPTDVATTEIAFVNMSNAVQSEISVNNLVDLKMSDKDYLAAILANYILGGGGNGKLFLNLREDKGWTYGAYSSIGAGKDIRRFSASTSVRNQVTDSAVVEIIREIKNIRTTPVTKEELETAKASYTGSFVRALERPATIANYAITIETENLDKDFYSNYLKNLNEVTVEDIQRVANKYFKEDNLRIVVTGKGSEVLEGLKNIKNLDGKPIPVKYYDEYANQIEEPSFNLEIDPSVSVKTVLDAYIQAIGGEAALQKVKNITTESSLTMQGMPLNQKSIITSDNQMYIVMSMSGMEIQKQVFDGAKGYISGQGQRIDYDESQVALLKASAYPFPELYAKEAKLVGAEMLDGNAVYVVQNGPSKKMYFDQKTGLKVQEQETQEVQGQEMITTVKYLDYKEFEGILLPTRSAMEAMGQEMELNIDKYTINATLDKDQFN